MNILKTQTKEIRDLKELYMKNYVQVKKRLLEFQMVNKSSNDILMNELFFCLLTPQSNAFACDQAVTRINQINNKDNVKSLEQAIYPIRFYRHKAAYVKEALSLLNNISEFRNGDPYLLRELLVKNVKGLGYKEASHFLRNIGHNNLAILDRHILKNLISFNVIESIPNTLTKSKYLEIEQRFKEFANFVDIPMGDLDLIFWAKQTGVIFK